MKSDLIDRLRRIDCTHKDALEAANFIEQALEVIYKLDSFSIPPCIICQPFCSGTKQHAIDCPVVTLLKEKK